MDLRTWIRDPVHGFIRLTDVEREVLDTAVFQRLRRVKQLGLACLAFPSADYPRFEHSLGVMHVTGRLLRTLQHKNEAKIEDVELQTYRLAAMLHDIGHYPFSHAMDDAISRFYSSTFLEKKRSKKTAAAPVQGVSHEQAGKLILRHDEELNGVLRKHKFDPDRISRIFNREDPDIRFVNMVSSDLDADRLDYLARTACHTGMPYGITDIDYLVERVQVDSKNRLCFDEKALRSIEHVLLARYFDYQTLVRHRVVAGLERLLQDILHEMLEKGVLSCTENDVCDMIKSKEWSTFDDLEMLHRIRNFGKTIRSPLLAAKLKCVLDRHPPKTVAEAEWFDDAARGDRLRTAVQLVQCRIPEWAKAFRIPVDHWLLWEPHKPMEFTKSTPLGTRADRLSDDKYEQSARVTSQFTNSDSVAVIEMQRSLMSVLSQYRFYAFRVIIVPPLKGVAIDKKLQTKINKTIRESCPDVSWR